MLFRHPSSVLDPGCGEGWLARELAAHGVEVTGVDAIPELVDAARKAGGAAYRVMSYEEIARGHLDISVDVVVRDFSLIGAAVVDNIVAAIPGLLKDEGALVVQTLHPSRHVATPRLTAAQMHESRHPATDQPLSLILVREK